MEVTVTVKDAKIYQVRDYGKYAVAYIDGLKFIAYETSKNGSATRADLIAATGKQVSLLQGYVGKPGKKADGTYYAPSVAVTKVELAQSAPEATPVAPAQPSVKEEVPKAAPAPAVYQ